MTFRSLSLYAALGLTLAAAGPALADSHSDVDPHYLNAPGIGAAADIGNNRAADVPMFDTNEHPKPLWVYDVDLGKHVLREDVADTTATAGTTGTTEEAHAGGPELDFGIDIR